MPHQSIELSSLMVGTYHDQAVLLHVDDEVAEPARRALSPSATISRSRVNARQQFLAQVATWPCRGDS